MPSKLLLRVGLWRGNMAQTASGARRDVYVLEALVIGPDYDLARNALLAELHAGGKGTLVHPYLGFLLVQVEDWTMEESTEEGGLARFSLTFSTAREDPPLR